MLRPTLAVAAVLSIVSSASAVSAGGVDVTTAAELRDAVTAAQPGDTIRLAPGTYRLDAKLSAATPGTAASPIAVVGQEGVTLEVDALEGIWVNAPHWRFADFEMVGVCADDAQCEHAFHIVGLADHTTLSGLTLRNFNAQIKGNGTPDGFQGQRVWPDDVRIEYSTLADDAPRQTANPVTKIDVVGGRRWRIVGNVIRDFAKAQGDQISYGAFLKGNSRDGVFERNLVQCAFGHDAGVRIGLSFGGGGTGPDSVCEDGTCTPEHQGGVMMNNIVANCSDVGIYLNEAADASILHNTLYDTMGIDARFDATSAQVHGNLLTGRIKDRDGGTSTRQDNLIATVAQMDGWFQDPNAADFALAGGATGTDGFIDAASALTAEQDYCLQTRDDAPDLGALEYLAGGICDTTQPRRMGPSGGDAGPGDGGAGSDGGLDGGVSDTGDSTDTGVAGDDAGQDAAASDDVGDDAAAGSDGGATDEPGTNGAGDEGCGCANAEGGQPAGLALVMLAWMVALVRRRETRPAGRN